MKVVLISTCFLFFSLTINAQQWLGISSSNYAGTNGVYLNPANIADSRFKCYVNLAGADASILNNYASWNAPYSMLSMATNGVSASNRNANGNIIWKNSYLGESTTDKNYSGFVNGEVRGPSFLYTFEKPQLTIGLSTRFRLLADVADANLDVARLVVEGTEQPKIYTVPPTPLNPRNNNHFAFNVNGFTEIAATVGYVVKDDDENFFKVGVSVKRIHGLQSTHVIANQVDYFMTKPFPNLLIFTMPYSDGQYGMVSDAAYRGISVSQAMFGSNIGTGYGADIGFVYEKRSEFDQYDYRVKDGIRYDGTQNKYDYKIGVSVLDFGVVNFSDPNFVSQTTISGFSTTVNPNTVKTISTFDKLKSGLDGIYNLTSTTPRNTAYSVPLPMALSLSFDYKVQENIYVSAVVVQSLRNGATIGMVQPSLFAVTPRYETKWFELSMPVGLLNNYQNLTLGLAGRAGPIFIGSDNLGGLLNIAKPHGLDIYAGVFIPIYRKMPKSSISCPNEVKQTMGEKVKGIFKKKKK